MEDAFALSPLGSFGFARFYTLDDNNANTLVDEDQRVFVGDNVGKEERKKLMTMRKLKRALLEANAPKEDVVVDWKRCLVYRRSDCGA